MIDKEEEEENSRVRGGRKGRGEERGSDYAGELAPSLKGRTYLLVLLALRQQPQTTLPPPRGADRHSAPACTKRGTGSWRAIANAREAVRRTRWWGMNQVE